MHVEKWLHQHGKKYPDADPDGSIPLSRFDEAGIPAIFATKMGMCFAHAVHLNSTQVRFCTLHSQRASDLFLHSLTAL
jgi:hypothetical protein